MRILALDLGTRMGWAMMADGRIKSGTAHFAPGKLQGPGARYLKLRSWLADTKYSAGQSFDLVVVERVINHVSAHSAHVYGGMLAHVQAWCEHHQMPLEEFSPGTIKKFATGKGNATKDEMIQSAKDAGYHPQDDNEADAIALLRMTIRNRVRKE